MIGAIDGFSSFIIQVFVLLAAILSSAFTLELDRPAFSGGGQTGQGSGVPLWVLVISALFVIGIGVVFFVPKYRRKFREAAVSSRVQLRVLRSPRKLLMLFGGNLAAQVFLAVALGMCLKAFGYQLPLLELLFINTLVSMFAGFMPVPGGVGVAEAAYTACLTAAGIPSSVAVSTAIMYRMMTFYLPPLWGSVATGWLRRHDFL